jgi:hypothetical protein
VTPNGISLRLAEVVVVVVVVKEGRCCSHSSSGAGWVR